MPLYDFCCTKCGSCFEDLMKKPEEGEASAETPPKASVSSASQAGTGNEAGAAFAPAAPRGAGKAEARGSASKKLDISAEDFE